MTIKYLISFFACIVFYRTLKNLSGLFRTRYYEKKYRAYLSAACDDFAQCTASVTHLFEQADLDNPAIPFAENISPGFVAHGKAQLFSNMDRLDDKVVSMMLDCFQKAEGTFIHSIKESLSVFFWIDKLVYLPRNILKYLGTSGESIVTKAFQLIYWILTPLLLIFREKICDFILSLIQ